MQTKQFNQVRLRTGQFETAEENAAFAAQARCVCALFARHARAHGAELAGFPELVGEFAAGPAPAGVTSRAGATVVATQADDIRGVMSLPDSERKRAFLHLILRTLDVVCDGRTPQP